MRPSRPARTNSEAATRSRTRPTTWAPRSSKPRTTQAPTRPVQPVTKTRRSCQDPPAVQVDFAEATARPYRRHRAELAPRAVERQQAVDVHVRQAVAVGEQEGVAFQVFFDALDSATGHAVQAGFRQSDFPALLGR